MSSYVLGTKHEEKMPKKPLASLGVAVREKRSARKLREVAKEIGISPATLMRVENGRVPDLVTFGKLCQWLNVDPGVYFALPESDQSKERIGEAGGPLVMSVHFRADKTPNENTVKALATMLLTAAGEERKLGDEEQRDGGS